MFKQYLEFAVKSKPNFVHGTQSWFTNLESLSMVSFGKGCKFSTQKMKRRYAYIKL